MSTATVTSREGDTLDLLMWRTRGLGPNELGAALTLNPGIAAAGAVLPAGTSVIIPAAPAASPVLETINLWD